MAGYPSNSAYRGGPLQPAAARAALSRRWENLKRFCRAPPWVQPCIWYRRSQKHLTLSSLCACKQLLARRGGRNVQGQKNLWEAANFPQPALGQTVVGGRILCMTPSNANRHGVFSPEFNILHKYLQPHFIFCYFNASTLYFKIMYY